MVTLGALTRGLQGEQLSEMAALKRAGCVGVSNAMQPLANTLVQRRALEYAATFGLTVFLSANDHWLASGGCAHEGKVATRLGLPGIPEASETAAVARDLALIEQTGVRAHFCRLTTARAVLKASATRKQVHLIQEHLVRLATDFDRFRKRMDNLSKHIQQANKDVEEVNTSARKISSRFEKIEKVELHEDEDIEMIEQ